MADQSFGSELRHRRVAAGMSLKDLAAEAYLSKSYISKLENGLQRPSPTAARACDAALKAGGMLLALLQERHEPMVPPPSAGLMPTLWSVQLAPDGRTAFAPIAVPHEARPDVVSQLSLTLNGSGLAAAAGPHSLAFFRSQLDQLRQFGQVASPTIVLPTVIVQTNAISALATAASEPVRFDLLRLAARYAEFAGWMAQEAGNELSASWWTNEAARIAALGGDTQLTTYAVLRHADLALYRHDAKSTVELAERVQLDRTVAPRIRGIAAQREAQGHALAADERRMTDALARSRALLDEAAASGNELVIAHSTNAPDPVEIARGWCLHDLGRHSEAAEVLDTQIDAMPAGARRARTLFGVRRASAYAAAGNGARVVELADELLDDAIAVDSATSRSELRSFALHVRRSRTITDVGRLMSRVSDALRIG